MIDCLSLVSQQASKRPIQMIDHVNIPVSDLESSRELYVGLLAPLGMSLLFHDNEVAGFGKDHWSFGIEQCFTPFPSMHIAFKAANEKMVDDFYRAALELGARDNGQPGLRAQYGDHYYAAYVLDADGHNVEAVFRGGAEGGNFHGT